MSRFARGLWVALLVAGLALPAQAVDGLGTLGPAAPAAPSAAPTPSFDPPTNDGPVAAEMGKPTADPTAQRIAAIAQFRSAVALEKLASTMRRSSRSLTCAKFLVVTALAVSAFASGFQFSNERNAIHLHHTVKGMQQAYTLRDALREFAKAWEASVTLSRVLEVLEPEMREAMTAKLLIGQIDALEALLDASAAQEGPADLATLLRRAGIEEEAVRDIVDHGLFDGESRWKIRPLAPGATTIQLESPSPMLEQELGPKKSKMKNTDWEA